MSAEAESLQYLRGWMAALDEMRRPDWREVYDQISRDIAAGLGRDLETIARELGFQARRGQKRRR